MVEEPQNTPPGAPLPGEVDADQVTLREDEFHALHLRVGDQEYEDVRPRRVFPVSGKVDFVSFLSPEDKEVALLTAPRRLRRASRALLNRALARLYYTPKILRVDAIDETMGVGHWRVQTDRGYVSFEVLDRNRHIRSLPQGRYLISDVDGNRYEIANVAELDERSQRLVNHET